MTLPNTIIVGAPKCGTTTLHYVLDQHPEIYMSKIKEPGFFWAYNDDNELQGPSAILLRHRIIKDLETYEDLFKDVTNEKIIGESSASYMFHPRSPKLIYQFLPTAKLLFILRQPADRAFSSFTQYERDGVEPCSNFSDAVIQERNGLRNHWTFGLHLKYGFYFQAIQRYLEFFPREQIFISLYDDLKSDPSTMFQEIYQFLGVNSTYKPDFSQRHNVSGIIQNPLLRFFWTNTNKLRAFIRPITNQEMRHKFSEWVFRTTKKPEFSSDLRSELTQYYLEDILLLQDFLQRDLSNWLATLNKKKL
jgi:hypothetical protein